MKIQEYLLKSKKLVIDQLSEEIEIQHKSPVNVNEVLQIFDKNFNNEKISRKECKKIT